MQSLALHILPLRPTTVTDGPKLSTPSAPSIADRALNRTAHGALHDARVDTSVNTDNANQ
jgi:hypothetical protein